MAAEASEQQQEWEGVWHDFHNHTIDQQALATRLLCFPFQSTWAFGRAVCEADCDGAVTTILCCPVRSPAGFVSECR